MKFGINHSGVNFDHKVLAEIISRHWREDRLLFALDRESPRAGLEGSWFQQPASGALELHWSRRCRRIPGAELPAPLQAKLLETVA